MTAFDGTLNPATAFDCVGALTINNVLMHCKAFNVLSVYPLIQTMPALVGENVRVNGVTGRRAYPHEVDETDAIVEMMVSGLYDENDNASFASRFQGLRHNYRYLRDNVFGPADGVTDAWYATIEWEWGEVEDAYVQVLDIAEVYTDEELVKTNMTVRVVSGDWQLVAS